MLRVSDNAGMSKLEVLTPDQMAAADRAAIAGGVAGRVLMERAGRAVADAILHRYAAVRHVLILCGAGNNGGDGFVAARHLAEAGMAVRVALLGDRSGLKGDAASAAADWSGPVEPVEDLRLDVELIVDALFGTGLSRPVEGRAADAIRLVSSSGLPVVSVDIPSGVDGRTGRVMGTAIKADMTVTFARLKLCHMLLPGRRLSGERLLSDIGISDHVVAGLAPKIFANRRGLWRDALPILRSDSHKYTRGHALIVTGGALTTGAGRLAARAALRAGAGLVTAAGPPEAAAILASALEAVMVRNLVDADDLSIQLEDRRITSLVIGPGAGVGEGTRLKVLAALRAHPAVVLDADALTSFEGRGSALAQAVKSRAAPVVLTPHDGEFSRLANGFAPFPDSDSKLERACRLSMATGAVVVLKGADTVVAAPDGRCSLADNAPPWLATAGSGDVLAGIMGGLLAQGMPGFEAASAAVWIHGRAAELLGPGMIAEDLPDALRAVIRSLLDEPSQWRYSDPLSCG